MAKSFKIELNWDKHNTIKEYRQKIEYFSFGKNATVKIDEVVKKIKKSLY